ncbi:hypothetical protein H920_02587 [Fukomys damarensis]|uniref:Uncharacterized protein n=1 Tax=Fukomys damarensis TaxID=885580 RepID=A0A091DV56_FUKDA|nr:hypothetical protein H920_02587 [Fukomys damarensis]
MGGSLPEGTGLTPRARVPSLRQLRCESQTGMAWPLGLALVLRVLHGSSSFSGTGAYGWPKTPHRGETATNSGDHSKPSLEQLCSARSQPPLTPGLAVLPSQDRVFLPFPSISVIPVIPREHLLRDPRGWEESVVTDEAAEAGRHLSD